MGKSLRRFSTSISSTTIYVVFGYDLLVEPVQDSNQIGCTFKALTDPETLGIMTKGSSPLLAQPT